MRDSWLGELLMLSFLILVNVATCVAIGLAAVKFVVHVAPTILQFLR